MKIGIDARLWDQTGVGRYIKNLTLNLQKIDNKNDYFLFVRSEDYENVKTQIKNNKWRLIKCDIKWHSIKEQEEFPRVLNRENLDLVHFPYFSVPVFYNKPFVVTIHDLIINHFPTGKASTLFSPLYYLKLLGYKFVIKMVSKKAKKIITPSLATKREVIEHLNVNENKVIVTYEAADEKISEGTKNNDPIFVEKYFLYVGNAYPHKNLERLIDAFDKIKDEAKDLHLVLVGNVDYFYNVLKYKVNDLNLTDRVLFYGKATDNQLKNLYKNAECLIMPSLMEGFGLPVLEAMANNCLVLCSDIESLKEITKENAIYFNPLNVNQMSEVMLNAYSKNYDKKILENGYKLSKEFSWEKTARETLRIYESSISLR